ncbi:hypothetical protein SCYAM73S_00010 [Streptomyces cyaneofuscatus]
MYAKSSAVDTFIVSWSITLSFPVRWAKKTRRSGAIASSKGSARSLVASAVRWNEPVRVAVQSPSAAPAAHWMPPSRCRRKASSWKAALSCPPAVNQERPPS